MKQTHMKFEDQRKKSPKRRFVLCMVRRRKFVVSSGLESGNYLSLTKNYVSSLCNDQKNEIKGKNDIIVLFRRDLSATLDWPG